MTDWQERFAKWYAETTMPAPRAAFAAGWTAADRAAREECQQRIDDSLADAVRNNNEKMDALMRIIELEAQLKAGYRAADRAAREDCARHVRVLKRALDENGWCNEPIMAACDETIAAIRASIRP